MCIRKQPTTVNKTIFFGDVTRKRFSVGSRAFLNKADRECVEITDRLFPTFVSWVSNGAASERSPVQAVPDRRTLGMLVASVERNRIRPASSNSINISISNNKQQYLNLSAAKGRNDT
jgi:hypothetical protein